MDFWPADGYLAGWRTYHRLTDDHILSVCSEQGSIVKQKDEICAVNEGNILL